MRKNIAIWSFVFLSVLGCGTILSNFPRDISSVALDNGVIVTIELNENIMAIRDPVVTKTITIDYGKRQLIHRSNSDDYDYRIYLIKQKKETIWVVEEADGYQTAEFSFSDKKAVFLPRYTAVEKGGDRDTLMTIAYTDLVLTVK